MKTAMVDISALPQLKLVEENEKIYVSGDLSNSNPSGKIADQKVINFPNVSSNSDKNQIKIDDQLD